MSKKKKKKDKGGRGYNPHRNKYKTKIKEQLANRTGLSNLPLEVVAFVKLKYCQHYAWKKIYELCIERFSPKIPGFSLNFTERRCYKIYEDNREEFKQARKEYTQKFREEFNEDREELLNTSLKAELSLADKLSNEINKITNALSNIDPLEDSKSYNMLTSSLIRLQKQLQQLTNTDRFRKIEENKIMLEQRKEILGTDHQIEDKGPREVKIVGEE